MAYYAEPTMLGASFEEQIALEQAVVSAPNQTREGGMSRAYPEDIQSQMIDIQERSVERSREPELELQEMGVPPLLLGGGASAVVKAVPKLPAVLPAITKGIATVGAGTLGLLAVENLFGESSQRMESGIELGGWGLKEPSKDILIKEWHVSYPNTRLQYYLVQKTGTNRRYIMLYNTAKKTWKTWAWRKPSLAVIGKNMPTHKMLTRLRRNLKRHQDDAKTLLKLVSPGSLKTSRSSIGWGGKHRHRGRK